ncbi:hypothetical protein HDV63DRAFT_192715 [Trichoderma sp. SZMC 28014]
MPGCPAAHAYTPTLCTRSAQPSSPTWSHSPRSHSLSAPATLATATITFPVYWAGYVRIFVNPRLSCSGEVKKATALFRPCLSIHRYPVPCRNDLGQDQGQDSSLSISLLRRASSRGSLAPGNSATLHSSPHEHNSACRRLAAASLATYLGTIPPPCQLTNACMCLVDLGA